jgi:biopolymer transport protein ExbD
MKIAFIFITALLAVQPVLAEGPTIESLSQRIELLEQKVATLSAQVAASKLTEQTADAPGSVTRGEITLDVLADGQLRVEGMTMDDEKLARRLKAVEAQYPGQAVRIRGDMNTKYQNIVRAIDLCQKSGIWNISFATAKPNDEQAGTGQPATRPVVEPKGDDKPQPEAERRSR